MAKQGKLKWYNHVKGYGFIARDEGQKDIFVHVSEFRKAGIKKIVEGKGAAFAFPSQSIYVEKK